MNPATRLATAQNRYSGVAIALHWMIAICIAFNLAVGYFMEGFRPGLKDTVVPLHISFGLTVLGLTLVRIGWRLTHAPPPLPDAMRRWQKAAAHAAHACIYFMMFAMPLTGWAIISAHPRRPGAGPSYFGWGHIPPISAISGLAKTAQKSAHDNFVELHSIGSWMFLALLALHVGAALKHQFLDGQRELARMGMGRRR